MHMLSSVWSKNARKKSCSSSLSMKDYPEVTSRPGSDQTPLGMCEATPGDCSPNRRGKFEKAR